MLSTADAQVNNWGTDGSSGHMELKSRMAGAKPSVRRLHSRHQNMVYAL